MGPGNTPDAVPLESVRLQVEKILRSEGFARSERLSRFLRYTVDQSIDGKASQLKEYVLGVEVFDKDSSFDPRIDTLVRVEARRLRTALSTYYAAAGHDDPILIEYPKGSYAPVFQHRRQTEPVPVQATPGTVDPPALAPLRRFGGQRLFWGLAVLIMAV